MRCDLPRTARSGAGRSRHRSLRIDPEHGERNFLSGSDSRSALRRDAPRPEGVRPGRGRRPYGGAFGVTAGIAEEFGEARCLDTPISESAIVGVSIGASQRGYRPVAEMQFADFISCGFDQIVNQAATLRYRTGGRVTCPIVVRAPSGGNVGGGLYHSQNPEAWFIHRPG
jgi:2-oxoisovalerate dehydrogenase E1 component beta subunit